MTVEAAPEVQNQPDTGDVAGELAKIAKHGDALDRAPRLRRWEAAGVTAIAGAAWIGSIEGTALPFGIENLWLDAPSLAVMALGATGAACAAGRFNRKTQGRRYENILATSRDLQERSGQEVEVFRDKGTKQLDLSWYAPDELRPARALLSVLNELANVATQFDIPHITVPTKLIDDYLPDKLEETSVTRNEWLKARKKCAVPHDELLGDQQVTRLDQQELATVIEAVKLGGKQEPLDTIMRLLSKIKPDHPALAFYARPPVGQVYDHKRLTQIMQTRLEQPLNYSEPHRTIDNDDGEYVHTRGHSHFQGRVRATRDGKVVADWLNNGTMLYERTTDLLEELRLDDHGLETILKYPDKFLSKKVVELCELVAWQTLKGMKVPISTETGEKDGGTDVHVPGKLELPEGFQSRLAIRLFAKKKERIIHDGQLAELRPIRRRRAIRSLGVLAVSALAATGLSYAVTQYFYNGTVRGHEPAGFQIYDQGMNIIGWTPKRIIEQTEQRMYEATGFAVPKLTVPPPPNFRNSESANVTDVRDRAFVGDVNKNGPKQTIWEIETFNGMETEGYWIDGRYNDLNENREDDLYWSGSSVIDTGGEQRMLPKPEELDKNGPLLKVTGVMNLAANNTLCDDSQYSRDIPKDEKKVCWELPAPVMMNTRIVAAQIAGYKDVVIRSVVQKDGRQVLLVPTEARGEVRLEYWLTPDSNSVVRAIEPTQFYERNGPGESTTKPQAAAEIDKAWEEYFGKSLPNDPTEREQLMEDAIKNQFKYRLSPFKMPPPGSLLEYSKKVLELKASNCNTANTLNVISNPELNAVVGFRNSDATEGLPVGHSILSTTEAHLWAIDKDGLVHDATPISGISAEDQKFFEEHYSKPKTRIEIKIARKSNTAKKVEYAGMVAAGLALVLSRKKIKSVARFTQQKSGQLYVERLPEKRLRQAYNALAHTLWTPVDREYSPSTEQLGRTKIIHALSDFTPTDQFASVSQSLKQTPGSPAFRRDARRVGRLIRALRYSRLSTK